ncbi:hypothetical protein [Tunicatimonas pelagia]|uniref:hypothetical protein n=1 Tax=Tunicatimonas pelagia TaxID=931531 RepID=UPI0026652393|nr:hypothetical protein [Tunicatimonas pelagia]WKN46468.1 hypothetical protein P0M28_30425 [Tunicatimonas pelagia]
MKDHSLAEVIWENKRMVSIYFHRIEGYVLATTHLNAVQDTYAVVVDGQALYAYNVGRFPCKDVYLFDEAHYLALEHKADRYQYVTYSCLRGDGLPDDLLIMLYDQHSKTLREELYAKELAH